MPHADHNEFDDDVVSKSQLKREMSALQEMGAELVALDLGRLARLPLPDRLRDAVVDMHRMSKHEARRRQLQYIGKLMRDVDPAPIRAALDAIQGSSRAETARLHRLEDLRERLLADEGVLTEIGNDYPGADLSRLRQMRRNALREKAENRPPKAFREMFRMLRELDAPENLSDEAGDADEASHDE